MSTSAALHDVRGYTVQALEVLCGTSTALAGVVTIKSPAQRFIGPLGRAVEAQGMINIVGSTKRNTGVGAVDRGGRGVNEMAALRMPATFEHVEEAREVGVNVGMRIDQ